MPGTTVKIPVPNSASGFADQGYIGVSRQDSPYAVRTTLVHEVNHVLRHPPAQFATQTDRNFNEYKTEFQAYWIAEYATEPNLDRRAELVRQHVLRQYENLRNAFRDDRRFRQLVNQHRRPDGNVLNSLRWETIEGPVNALLAGSATPQQRALIRATMSSGAADLQAIRSTLAPRIVARLTALINGSIEEGDVRVVWRITGSGLVELPTIRSSVTPAGIARVNDLLRGWVSDRDIAMIYRIWATNVVDHAVLRGTIRSWLPRLWSPQQRRNLQLLVQ